jgi:hypothetical protein
MRNRAPYAHGALWCAAFVVACIGDGAAAACAQEPERYGLPAHAPTLRINGFAEVRYVATDTAGSRNGFALGQFDLFVRSLLSDRFGVLSEIVVHPGARNQFRVVLERVLLSYSRSDRLTAAVGRFHTAIGYYNAAYHHGTWFQTATGRPLIAAFEGDGGVLPIHTLGISMTGVIGSPLGLRWVAEIGNGRASQAATPPAPQPALTDNNTIAVNAGVRLKPDELRGLEAGVSLYHDRVTPDTLPAMREDIAAAYLVYRTADVELLAEGVAMRHATGGTTTAVDGAYLQASRALGQLRPYVRFDLVDAAPADPLFGFLRRRDGVTVGVRWDVEEFTAVKLQASRLRRTGAPAMGRFEAQVAFAF